MRVTPLSAAVGTIALCALVATPAVAGSVGTPTADLSALCAPADGLAASGALSDARSLYVKELEAHADLTCASAGIQSTDIAIKMGKATDSAEEAEALCTRARTDKAAHRQSDAIASFKAALEKDPKSTSCGAQGLRGESPGWFSRVVDDVETALPSVLAGIGLAVLGILLFLMLGHVKWFGSKFKRLWIIRAVLRGRLSFSDCDDSALAADAKIGKAFSAALRERLQHFRSEALDSQESTYGLDFGTGDEMLADIVSGDGQLGSAVAKLGEASDHTKLIAAVIGGLIAILPIRRLALSGVLGPAAEEVQADGTKGSRLNYRSNGRCGRVGCRSGGLWLMSVGLRSGGIR